MFHLAWNDRNNMSKPPLNATMYPFLIGRRLPEAQPNLHQKVGLAFKKSFSRVKRTLVTRELLSLGEVL